MTIQQSIPPPSDDAPAAERRRASRDDGNISRDQAAIRAAAVLPGWAISTVVLRDAEIAFAHARHHSHQTRKHQGMDIPMCGVPVERPTTNLQSLIEAGHRSRVLPSRWRTPRRHAPAANKSGSPPRRGAAGDAGHADEDTLLDARTNKLSAGDRGASAASAGSDPLSGSPGFDISTAEFHRQECSASGACGESFRASIPTRPSFRRGSMAIPIWDRCCANCRR